MGEVTWSKNPMPLGDLRRLELKAREIERLQGRPVRFAFVARAGFEQELTAEAKAKGSILLDLQALQQILDKKYARPRQ